MKKTHIVGIIVIAIAMLSMLSMMGNSSTYSNFTDAKTADEEVHVAGTLVKTKPMEYKPEVDPNKFSFYMLDKNGEEMKVVLNKSKPQDFERAEQIVIIGAMEGNSFVANDILMKCPSKYNDGQQAL